jgi:hypothetical protein
MGKAFLLLEGKTNIEGIWKQNTEDCREISKWMDVTRSLRDTDFYTQSDKTNYPNRIRRQKLTVAQTATKLPTSSTILS